VKKTIYPSLPNHPDHGFATRQSKGFGGVVSFELHGGLHAGAMFTDTLKLPHIAPSLGGCDSLVEQPTVRASAPAFPTSARTRPRRTLREVGSA
jgi:cystathionine gamma-synthase